VSTDPHDAVETIDDAEVAPEQVAPVDDVAIDDAPVDAVVESDDDTVPSEPVAAMEEDALTTTDEPAGDADVEVEDEIDPKVAFRSSLLMQDGDWYVVHSYSGHEKRVKQAIEHRVVSLNMEDYIFQVEVPMEDVVEYKNGQKKQVTRVRMPGYVLVRMELGDASWGAVRNTPGVTGFVGHAHQPVPLTPDEVYSMMAPPSNSTSRWEKRSPSPTARSQRCLAPFPRSTWRARSSTSSYQSSAARLRSNSRSRRFRRSTSRY